MHMALSGQGGTTVSMAGDRRVRARPPNVWFNKNWASETLVTGPSSTYWLSCYQNMHTHVKVHVEEHIHGWEKILVLIFSSRKTKLPFCQKNNLKINQAPFLIVVKTKSLKIIRLKQKAVVISVLKVAYPRVEDDDGGSVWSLEHVHTELLCKGVELQGVEGQQREGAVVGARQSLQLLQSSLLHTMSQI